MEPAAPFEEDPMSNRMMKITHGKNGVEEIPVIPCTQEFHENIKGNDSRWASEVDDKKIWDLEKGERLYIGKCVYCGSVLARLFDVSKN